MKESKARESKEANLMFFGVPENITKTKEEFSKWLNENMKLQEKEVIIKDLRRIGKVGRKCSGNKVLWEQE